MDREIELLRREQNELAQRMARLEAWRDNENAKHATVPAWLFGSIAAIIGMLTLLLNLYLASR
jgi:hypothetical protein